MYLPIYVPTYLGTMEQGVLQQVLYGCHGTFVAKIVNSEMEKFVPGSDGQN